MTKRLVIIFLLAFGLNALWENAHSFLYSNYMGGEITEYILLRASLFDALIITCLLLPFLSIRTLEDKSWLLVFFGILIAIGNEWWGLGTGRWAYNALMPIIPLIKVGLTPTLQLGITGYISYKLQT